MTPKTAILGFGNPVRSDDGIGCYVIEQLRQRSDLPPQVSLFDMGTSAFEVLFQLAGHGQFIIVDAVVNSGEPVGTLFRLPAEAVEAAIQDDPMVFLHGLKWDQALSYARKILREQYPDDITVFLIAVDDTHLDVGLSEAVRAAGNQVLDHIFHECLANQKRPSAAAR
ncbi:hydrogenase maturation protease [Hymenobacter terricola]|uniref:hydrogenase maturation protease n=1 Tax=Hymenobacter terricola TaxID=2819236 RepID=UPI001B3108F6|nr:hydrogenase maturation protease [Hymenobacter terricola]